MRIKLIMTLAVALCPVLATNVCAEDVAINEENFPDAAFREYLLKEWDEDKNGKLSDDERLSYAGWVLEIKEMGIASLKGIEFFPDLKALYCNGNQLTELDLSHNPELMYLYCNNNQLTRLDLSSNPKMEDLTCYGNQLEALNVSGCTGLTTLKCNDNRLTSLDLSTQGRLTILNSADNANQMADMLKDGKSYIPLASLEALGFDRSRISAAYIETVDGTDCLCLGPCASDDEEVSLTYSYSTGNATYPTALFTLARLTGQASGITAITTDGTAAKTDVYSVGGRLIKQGVAADKALDGLPEGLYIVRGKKVVK